MNKTFVIGVAGGSGSGKTSFLKSFLSHFNQNEICTVSQDDYYRPKDEQPIDKNGWINFDFPECIDHQKLLEDLNTLIAGESVQKKEYTFNVAEDRARTLLIQPAPIILVEGLFIFHYPNIASLFNMRIFIDAEEANTLNRRLKRDIAERGYTHEMIMYQWENHVLPAYQAYLLPYKATADKIIFNNESLTDINRISNELSEELKQILRF